MTEPNAEETWTKNLMLLLLLDFVVALGCGVAGWGCGWLMHATYGQAGSWRFGVNGPPNRGNGSRRDATDSCPDSVEREEFEQEQRQMLDVAQRLRNYASTMAADVDAHQTRVQAVNDTLRDPSSLTTDDISDAVDQLITANQEMQRQLQEAQACIHEQTLRIESAERRAETDALTRIANRGSFDRHLQECHDTDTTKPKTVALFDIDHFKTVNDSHGHQAGDEVLRVVAGILSSRLGLHGHVSRFGGEEFAAILDDCTGEEAAKVVEATRMVLGEREIPFEGKNLRVTASCGIAQLQEGETIEAWVGRADEALYFSKNEGRNCGHWMDGETPIRCTADLNDLTGSPSPDPLPAAAPPTPDAHQEVPTDQEADIDQEAVVGTDATPGPQETETGKPFHELPDRQELAASFDKVRQEIQDGVSLSVMVIHGLAADDPNDSRSLQQAVRAGLRSVDRLGCIDSQTLAVCMPSMDENTARSRGEQILRSLKSVNVGAEDDESPVQIGVALAQPDIDFDAVVGRALQDALANTEETAALDV